MKCTSSTMNHTSFSIRFPFKCECKIIYVPNDNAFHFTSQNKCKDIIIGYTR